jgi:hypothetical protein
MQIEFINSIKTINSQVWDRLNPQLNPFVSHAFLAALEQHQGVCQEQGWLPHHAVVYNQAKQIIGAAPLYLKFNSYGEFVFDWAWADAYRRYGRSYYPKLVCASPYSPVPGPRLLTTDPKVRDFLLQAIIREAENQGLSSFHCLFTQEQDNQSLQRQQLEMRNDCQFHWHNRDYRDFDHFLSELKQKKRKNIKQERRQVEDAAIRVQCFSGDQVSEAMWADYHRHYCSTFDRRGGYATLSQSFFMQLAQDMPQNIVLIAAFSGNKQVASAFCLRDTQALYGRHWGCDQSYNGLHFETCYYQGIDYCIRHQLQLFQPGAQGEHKLSRGFLPTLTYSGHWILNEEFDKVLRQFMRQERYEVSRYMQMLQQHYPFKTNSE